MGEDAPHLTFAIPVGIGSVGWKCVIRGPSQERLRRGESNLIWCRCSLIHEGPRLWAGHVVGFERIDSEPGGTDQFIHLRSRWHPAPDPLPAGSEPVLP